MIIRDRMIFRDIENCIVGTKKQIDEEASYEEPNITYLKKMAQRLAALERIGEYLDANKWLVREDAKKRITTIRALKYDYTKAGEELGMTYDAIRTFMTYCNKVAKEKVGENTIDLIMEDKIQVALVQFESLRGTYGVDKLFIEGVESKLPKAEFKPTTLGECSKEIEFLYDMSRNKIEERLEGLDMEKLQFLLYILTESTPKYSGDKYDMVGMLTGMGMGLEEYIRKVEIESGYRVGE